MIVTPTQTTTESPSAPNVNGTRHKRLASSLTGLIVPSSQYYAEREQIPTDPHLGANPKAYPTLNAILSPRAVIPIRTPRFTSGSNGLGMSQYHGRRSVGGHRHNSDDDANDTHAAPAQTQSRPTTAEARSVISGAPTPPSSTFPSPEKLQLRSASAAAKRKAHEQAEVRSISQHLERARRAAGSSGGVPLEVWLKRHRLNNHTFRPSSGSRPGSGSVNFQSKRARTDWESVYPTPYAVFDPAEVATESRHWHIAVQRAEHRSQLRSLLHPPVARRAGGDALSRTGALEARSGPVPPMRIDWNDSHFSLAPTTLSGDSQLERKEMFDSPFHGTQGRASSASARPSTAEAAPAPAEDNDFLSKLRRTTHYITTTAGQWLPKDELQTYVNLLSVSFR